MKDKMKRNIGLDYIFRFLTSFSLTEAIWVLYLAYKGLSLAQIGLLEGVFHITSLISEVPSGVMADRMGRKKVILLGRISNIISSFIMLKATEMWQFGISFVFTAWGFNLLSGSEDALVYDSFLCMDEEEGYFKTNSRLNVIMEIGQGLATFIGGILSEISFTYCYVATVVVTLISLVPCMMFQEPELQESKKKEKVTWKEHFVRSFQVIRGNRKIAELLFFYSFVFTFYTSVYFYSQQYFLGLGLRKIQISVIMLLAGVMSCVGALCSEKAVKTGKEHTKYVATFVIAVGILGLSLGNIVLSIGCIAVISFFNAMLYPNQSASLNRMIPSEQRATIISVSSMTFSVFMIVLFPIMGWSADCWGMQRTFLIVGVVEMGVLSILIWHDNNRKTGILEKIKIVISK